MSNKVTFHDVARLVGVSSQTVSRVTNNNPNVNERTRQKVLAAIEQLGYVPNKSAQLLSRKTSRLIGLVTLDFSRYGATMIAAGIRAAAQVHGYSLTTTVADSDCLEDVTTAIRELRAQQVDALIINTPLAPAQAQALIKVYPELPLVFTDTYPAEELFVVTSDHYQGGRLSAQLLLEKGCRRIACLNGPSYSPAAILRRQGWLDTLQQNDLTFVSEQNGNWSAEDGYRLTRTLLIDKEHHPDAILCANDQMALGVLRALHEEKLRIPEQVAVTGFDDTPDSSMFYPPLTTVHQHFTVLGEALVENLLDRLVGRQAKSTRHIEVALIKRQSTPE